MSRKQHYTVGRWYVQVGKNKKSGYKTKYSFDNANIAVMWFNGINCGNGFKKRILYIHPLTGKRITTDYFQSI